MEEIINEELGTKLLYEKMPYKIKGSVIICAGGGYVWLSDREEWPIAHRYAQAGYQTYILKYSTLQPETLKLKPLMQLAWAMKAVRGLAAEDAPFVAVCGCSAGGHLCATLGVHWNDDSVFPKEDQKVICPDAMVLAYPPSSVSYYNGTEFSSQLYGEDKELEKYMTILDYVSPATPPAFIWHTITDETVPVRMTVQFADKLIQNGVFTEIHLFPEGPHGLSVATPDVDDPPKNRFANAHIANWVPLSQEWLEIVRRRLK